MVEKLTVRNFAGIKELEIEVKKVNILIGPQASGKSVCSKLLFYFKSFPRHLIHATTNSQDKKKFDLFYEKKFSEYFPTESWGSHDFFIRYEISNLFIEVYKDVSTRGGISIKYSDFLKKELIALRRIKKNWETSSEENIAYNDNFLPESVRFSSLLGERLMRDIKEMVCDEASFSQLFIPAGRSFFSNLQKNIFSFLSSNNSLDPFLREFGSQYEMIKNMNRNVIARSIIRSAIVSQRISKEKSADITTSDENLKKKKVEDEICRLIDASLCGKHISVKGEDFLEIEDGRRINVGNASSGQQETLPLTIMLSQLERIHRNTGKTVYIEEPEAHLFPSAQRNIIELIITIFNTRKEQLQFFITTHSPYLLTALNNLLQAGNLYSQVDGDVKRKLEDIIPQYKALEVNEFSAYVLTNGTCRSIICSETGLIDASVIDSVSDEIAVKFDQLLDLI